ncbi:MAG: NYN domain-containing protein [Bacteroidetes bacterium]|nr:NYN domain-containing protein [Bacteroidota bacterium]
MTNKVVILIDGGFFIPRFKTMNSGRGPRVADLQTFITGTMTKVRATNDAGVSDVLFRTFWYDCRPFGGQATDPKGNVVDFSTHPQFAAATAFQKDLRTFPQLALRLGDLSFDGWKYDSSGGFKPDFKQKAVDMKIGLDIAWMAGKRTVDKIVLVAGDSDFVSPMKYARRGGLLVYLEPMGQTTIKMELKEHADFLL